MRGIQDELAIAESMRVEESWEQRRLWAALNEIESDLRLFAAYDGLDTEKVYWLERAPETAAVMWAAPLDVAPVLQERLYKEGKSVIYTSATLSQNDAFEYAKLTLGAANAAVSKAESSFDYSRQCLVYVPSRNPANAQELAERIEDMLRISGGRALVLFNRTETMQAVRSLFERRGKPAYTLLWEGDQSNRRLLERFMAEETSVLCGLSYWEGISIAGPALSQCMIVELPHPQENPILQGKRRLAVHSGRNPRETIDIPEMITKLRQGAGRLIRSCTDYGIISCLDSSFTGTDFEADVWAAFPSGAAITRDAQQAASFLAAHMNTQP